MSLLYKESKFKKKNIFWGGRGGRGGGGVGGLNSEFLLQRIQI